MRVLRYILFFLAEQVFWMVRFLGLFFGTREVRKIGPLLYSFRTNLASVFSLQLALDLIKVLCNDLHFCNATFKSFFAYFMCVCSPSQAFLTHR